jgi:hypothetical protein
MEITQLIWFIAVTILALVNIVWQFDLQTRQRRLRERYERSFTSTDGEDRDLQSTVGALLSRVRHVEGKIDNTEALLQRLDSTLAHSIQGVGMVRFRAFQDTGGDQSFTMALVDGSGNGAVLSVLHSREGPLVYGKPVLAWTSSYNLSGEEEEALGQARAMVESG